MSDSRLYRCPFAANVSRLNGMPTELHEADGFDLRGASNLPAPAKSRLRDSLHEYLYNITMLDSCDYCAGRTYGDPEIKPGIQAKKALSYTKY